MTGTLCLFLLAACAGPDKPAATAAPSATTRAAPSPTDRLCADPELNDKQVAFAGQAGTYLAGYLLGQGGVTLVLAPQAAATGCSWLAWAKQQAAAGYRVLAFDFNGEGRSQRAETGRASGDIAAAVAFARAKGGRDVVLIGASRGATATLVAAAGLEPPATAVISLSGPADYAGEDALPAVPRLDVPVLYVAASGDSAFASSAQQLYDATPGNRRSLAIVPGQLHGTALLTVTGDGAAEAAKAVEDFLKAGAPPKP
ncbi:alpha/beta hydrolase family protein [Dactylosporangium sp. CA-139066]|uniref:alpha/beta hydrolase family protein n=1 Tax=Dactylosporangium sp. CA-139066 TaxID=3239930 RepID=UPI003D8E90E5